MSKQVGRLAARTMFMWRMFDSALVVGVTPFHPSMNLKRPGFSGGHLV